MANAQHSSEEHEHGTPVAQVELVRYVLGSIDYDPCSSSYWNYWTVKAKRFDDERSNSLLQHWSGNVILNAPSNRKLKISVRPFWERLAQHYIPGHVDAAVYIGFSLEQLSNLQSCPAHPAQFINLIPCDRIPFLRRTPGNGPPVVGDSPTHSNFLTLLPSRSSATAARGQVARFMERARDLEIGGAIMRPMT